MGNDGSGFFDTRRAADYLGLSPRTLDGYRVSGDGPAFHRFGNRVRYRRPAGAPQGGVARILNGSRFSADRARAASSDGMPALMACLTHSAPIGSRIPEVAEAPPISPLVHNAADHRRQPLAKPAGKASEWTGLL